MNKLHLEKSDFYRCHDCFAIFMRCELVEGRPPEHNVSNNPNETPCFGSCTEADMVIPRVVESP